jgi:hypothetical protein
VPTDRPPALPDRSQAVLPAQPAADADAGSVPADTGDLAADRTRASESPAPHRPAAIRRAAGGGLPQRLRQRAALRAALEGGHARLGAGAGLYPAGVRTRRGVP